jgi:hypothetical protein
MKVLLLESSRGLGFVAARELERAGHTVLRCDSRVAGALCRGLEPGGECPLDQEVSVAVLAHSGDEFSQHEHGALCAARQRIPVVVTTEVVEPGIFSSLATAAGSDLVEAVDRAASSGAEHAAAVRRELLALGVLSRADLEGDAPAVAVDVRREPGRLLMTLWLEPEWMRADGTREAQVVKSATEALRRFDPHVRTVDVRVRTSTFVRPC